MADDIQGVPNPLSDDEWDRYKKALDKEQGWDRLDKTMNRLSREYDYHQETGRYWPWWKRLLSFFRG